MKKSTKKLVVFLSPVLVDSNFLPSLAAYKYEKDGVDIAFCGVQQAPSIESVLSARFRVMAEYPQISHFITSTKEGDHAYLLSRGEGEFPNLRKLQARGAASSEMPGYWEDLGVQNFLKPRAGMVDALIKITQATHVLVVWIGEIDRQTAIDLSFTCNCQIHSQSFSDWMAEAPRAQPQPSPAALGVSVSTNTRRFEFIDPSQNASKFWQIALHPDGLGFTTGYGRIGTKGQSRSKVFTTPFACQCAYDDIIKQKLRKGYVET